MIDLFNIFCYNNNIMNTSDKNTNIHKDHRKRVKQKFLKNGITAFEQHEVLEMLLFYAIPRMDTNRLAHELINKYGSFSGVFEASIQSLIEVPGVNYHTAILLKLIPAITNICATDKIKNGTYITSSFVAKKFVRSLFQGLDVENFFIICITANSRVIDTLRLTSNEVHKVDVPIRKVTNFILKNNCSRVILAHNHPNGSAKPSYEDISLTRKLINSCVLNDIDIIDHMIYTKHEVYGFAEHGDMSEIKEDVVRQLKESNSNIILHNFSTSVDPYKYVNLED